MTDESNQISNAFRVFMSEAPEFTQTRELAYLAVLAAPNRTSGIAFHVASLKKTGATREEVIGAILIGLPAAGHLVTQSLPVAIQAYGSEQDTDNLTGRGQ